MASDTQDPRSPVDSLKHYGIVLLLAGMTLIVGSCIPLGDALRGATDSGPAALRLLTDGRAVDLELAEPLTAVPLVRVEPRSGGVVDYTLSITGTSGETVLREAGKADLDRSAAGLGDRGNEPVALRFPKIPLAAGHWTIRFQARPPAAVADTAELRLVTASPGLVPGLVTALTLAILGWLSASLGALQWIRAEAGRPLTGPDAGDGERERAWTVGCHLSALLGYVLPFGHLIGPSAIWLLKRRALPGLERTGRDVLNFQLSATLYVLAGLFLSFFLIGVVVLFAVVVFHFAVVLHASLRAQRGEPVKYPLTMRFI